MFNAFSSMRLRHRGHEMCTQPAPKTLVCRDCGYELTLQTHSDDEIPFHFCERCGGQNYDSYGVDGYIRQKAVKYLKDLLHTKIF